ncbi:MAG: DUF3467 domain-containing protein [Planctomycetota bacterium]|jgi:hypothetical protein
MSADKKGAKKAAAAPAAEGQEGGGQLQVHMSPDLEYSYRDFFSVFVGGEEVVIDFGNRHRAQADRATIQNHIVMSVQNAFRLNQALARSLEEARKRVQEAAKQAQEQAKEKK